MSVTTGDNTLEHEGHQYVCRACIGDRILAEQVEREGVQAKCTYCQTTEAALTLSALSNCIHQVLEKHFQPIPEDDIPEQWRRSFDDAETAIEEVAKLEQGIAADVREYLFNRFARTVDAAERDENPYSHRMLYGERQTDTSDFRSAWWDLKNETRSRARYFGATTVDTLDKIFENLDFLTTFWDRPVIREIRPGEPESSVWRGRIAHSDLEVEPILQSLGSKLGPPPSDRTTAGRMNAEGIPVFYGALEEQTCVAEVRAPVGGFVVLGKFDLLRPIRILDLHALSNAYSEVSYFHTDYAEQRSRETFLAELVGEIGRPIMPHEEAREYIATQVVSEYLANRIQPSLHGIIFPSSQTAGHGRNVVLFNGPSVVEPYEPPPGIGLRVVLPRQPIVPPPGSEPSKDLLIQTEPQGADGETERGVEDPTTSAPEAEGNHGDNILRLDPQSVKVLAISGVKYQSKSLPLNRDYHVSGGTVRFHFDVPTPKVTVSRKSEEAR